MPALSPFQTLVAEDVILDGRLGLFHRSEKWLAVADLHYGYEISQRNAGRLMPLWGMDSSSARLFAMVEEYRPRHLVIVGDIVHDRAAAASTVALLEQLERQCAVIALAGNHDRHLAGLLTLRDTWETERFHFHHGHCAKELSGRIQVIGHHHPAGTIRDGAGLRLKLPAFVQQDSCWVLPAFSPWAAGVAWRPAPQNHIWLCSPARILRLPTPELAPTL